MYIIGFLYLFSLVFLGNHFKSKNKVILAMIPFILIAFLRFGVGADYLSYENIYLKTDLSNFKESMSQFKNVEPLYKVLSMSFKALGFPYHVFTATMNSIISLSVVLWIRNHSPKFWQSVLLYFSMFFLFWNLSALRQGISMTLMFYAFFNQKNNSKTQKIVLTVIASLIHVSSLIVLPLYLASKFSWNKKRLLLILLLAPIAKLVLSLDFLMFLTDLPFMNKLVRYLGQDPISIFEFTTLVRLLFFGVIWLHYDDIVEKYNEQVVLINFTILSMLLYLFIPVSKVIATRVTIFGYFGTIIIFPMIISLYDSHKLRVVSLIGLLSFSSFSMVNELEKAKDRSAYDNSILSLNFETIFESNRKHFSSYRAFESTSYHHTTSSYKEDKSLASILEKDIVVESPYREELRHISVKFDNGLYGVINEYGEIVKLPTEENRYEIIDNYYIESVVEQYQYSYLRARSFETNLIASKEKLETLLNQRNAERVQRESTRILRSDFDIETLEQDTFLDLFNPNALYKTTLHIDTYNPKLRYLQLSTAMHHYYLLVDENNNVLVDRLYSSLSRINDRGFLEGRTRDYIEYFNKKGELIWVEKI